MTFKIKSKCQWTRKIPVLFSSMHHFTPTTRNHLAHVINLIKEETFQNLTFLPFLFFIFPKNQMGRRNIQSFFFLRILYNYIWKEIGREKKRERNINVWLALMCPLLGTWPTTQACVLTGNRTRDSFLHSPVLSPLSHTS